MQNPIFICILNIFVNTFRRHTQLNDQAVLILTTMFLKYDDFGIKYPTKVDMLLSKETETKPDMKDPHQVLNSVFDFS